VLRDAHEPVGAPLELPVRPRAPVDERAARESLRRQIGKLERDLAEALADRRPGDAVPTTSLPRLRGPRLLSLGELERVRDAQADRLSDMRAELAARAEREAEMRILLEKMLLEPGHHRFVRVSQAELGEPGCGVYHVRPRLGIIGMLAGWWHVKVSSGCPLAEPRLAARPRTSIPLLRAARRA
jgi:hypothetical protein